MTFRGTVINGVVVPDPGQSLPEGTRVALSPLTKGGGRRGVGRRAASGVAPGSKSEKAVNHGRYKPSRSIHPLTALAGIWKDRPDWKGKSSVQIVAELRRRSSGPRRG